MLFKRSILVLLLLFPYFAYSNTSAKISSIPAQTPTTHINALTVPGITLGENSKAEGDKSIAIGVNSHATNTQSVAIGYGAVATEENTVSFGDPVTKTFSQLSNIKDGIKQQDAVTVSQLKKEVSSIKNGKIAPLERKVNQNQNNINRNTSLVKELESYYRDKTADIANKVGDIDREITTLRKKVFASTASTVAISSIPYLAHQRFSGGMGISNYRTGTAIAGGLQYRPTEAIAVRINTAINSEKDFIIGGGLAYGW